MYVCMRLSSSLTCVRVDIAKTNFNLKLRSKNKVLGYRFTVRDIEYKVER